MSGGSLSKTVALSNCSKPCLPVAANWYVYYPRYTIPPTEILTRPPSRYSPSSGGGSRHTGVAGWAGGPTTPEPALGAHDRINTTDLPEEIEARPDKSISLIRQKGETGAKPSHINVTCLLTGFYQLASMFRHQIHQLSSKQCPADLSYFNILYEPLPIVRRYVYNDCAL